MWQKIKSSFQVSVPEQYEQEFEERLYQNNLERAYLISLIGVASFFLIIMANILAFNDPQSDDRMISVLSFISHILLSFFLIPAFLEHDNRNKFLSIYFKDKRNFFFFTLSLLVISLLPMSVVALINQESIIVFIIMIILVNLGFKLPPKTNLLVNLITMVLITLCIVYIVEWEEMKTFSIRLFECWVLSAVLAIIAAHQYTSTIKQFNNEKVVEQQNQIIKAQMEEKFNRQLSDMELTAFRAQMNPHFLFNVLNSIKLYVIQNDARTASRFLTKFARLIRLILNNSKSSVISLTEELNALKLYIEMENFRFNGKFDYQINVSKRVKTDNIKIPPLILQPYVENAIWHGLMHKEEDRGKLLVNIKPTKDETGLYFIIEDNGIGRKKAREIKTRTAAKHKSVGMQITKNRIEIANQLFDTNTTVKVEDLKDKLTGKATGTRVTVQLPLKVEQMSEVE